MADTGNGQREIDIKKYCKIEKIPGGAIEDCRSAVKHVCAVLSIWGRTHSHLPAMENLLVER